MIYKTELVRDEFTQAPTHLQVIVAEFERISRKFGIEPIMTRVREKISGSSGVHEAGRAVDLRDEYPTKGNFLYNHEQREKLVKTLNARYYRNDNKNTIIWHSFKGGMHHFHVQLAPSMSAYKLTKEESKDGKNNGNNKLRTNELRNDSESRSIVSRGLSSIVSCPSCGICFDPRTSTG